MPTNLKPEQILALAPDNGVAQSGRSLATLRNWSELGQSELAAWGACKGSGKEPYKVQIDLREPAFRCSCPSHKFPCKHGIGLLVLLATQPANFPTVEPPAWVTEWLAKRAETTQRKQASAQKEPSGADLKKRAAAQEQRVASREASVAAGLDDLSRWLADLLRQGLATCPSRSPGMWEAMAARMVDAQAPGVARMLRDMAGIPASGEGWQARLLERLARLQLLIVGYQRSEQLPADLLAELRSQIGWVQDQERIRSGGGVRDDWLVLGQSVEEEQQLSAQRIWLWALTAQQPALILNFVPIGRPHELSLATGTTIHAELAFFAGAVRLRAALVGQPALVQRPIPTYGYTTLESAIQAYATALARNPWLERFPLPLQAVLPHRVEQDWYVRDTHAHALPLAVRGLQGWRLLALSAGQPIVMMGTWDGHALTPLSMAFGDRLIRLEE
jgi:hypothetical protein